MPEDSQSRKLPRYHTNLDVLISNGAQAFQGRVVQVNRGGCLIFPPLPPQPTPEVRLSFRLAEYLPVINCKGEIAYSIGDKGTGIVFTEISLYNQDLITKHFEKQASAQFPFTDTATTE